VEEAVEEEGEVGEIGTGGDQGVVAGVGGRTGIGPGVGREGRKAMRGEGEGTGVTPGRNTAGDVVIAQTDRTSQEIE